MASKVMNARVPPMLAQTQLDDLAELFAKTLAPGNLAWLGSAVLGIDILRENGNKVGNVHELSALLVSLLHECDAIVDAVALLQRESRHNGYLSMSMAEILRGERLNSANLQALISRYEPFFNSAEFRLMLPRVCSTVCAVARENRIEGSGFLIGPDLVMTNFHVVLPFLDVSDGGKVITQRGDGTKLKCVFDYQFEPPPVLRDDAAGDARAVLVVPAAEKWLVHARVQLPHDGTDQSPAQVDKEYDYAVIRLAKAVGQRPARVSGGAIRGWLLLPKDRCDFTSERRIVVFQHPAGAAQQMDIGQLVQLDPTTTRVWYSVSTAKGSSGGAAVDLNGELLALHNAEVVRPLGPAALVGSGRVNQGIRIDLIAEDLKQSVAEWKPAAAAELSPLAFWSLTDNRDHPRPVIGRRTFRENVVQMMMPGAERVMTVVGEYGTFARFSVALLQRTLGSQVLVARFTPNNMQTLPPEEFVRALMDQLGVQSDADDRMPAPPPTETRERWQAIDLPAWVLRQLERHAKLRLGVFPAWVAIDVTVPPGESILWKSGLRDLLTALVGVRDAGQVVDIPQLRWLFLSTSPLPLGNVPRLEEDLVNDMQYDQDFVECVRRAWVAVDKTASLDDGFVGTVARIALANNKRRPAGERVSTRKALALHVIELLHNAPR